MVGREMKNKSNGLVEVWNGGPRNEAEEIAVKLWKTELLDVVTEWIWEDSLRKTLRFQDEGNSCINNKRGQWVIQGGNTRIS